MKRFSGLTDDGLKAALHAGQVGVIPTDTVYGIVCRAQDSAAVERLYSAKHREHKPGTIIAASIDQLVELGLKRRYMLAIADYWPGALSAVIPCGPELQYLHQGKFGLAVRVPADDTVRELLKDTGPLLTSSANQPGKPPATSLAEAEAYFGADVDFYAEGGDLSGRQSSTVIRVVDDTIEVLRQGAVII